MLKKNRCVFVYFTTTCPIMNGCKVQQQSKVPALSNVCEKVFPLAKYEESNLPEGPESGVPEVAVCKVASLFVHVTVVPTATFAGDGSQKILLVGAEDPGTIEMGVPACAKTGTESIDKLVQLLVLLRELWQISYS